MVRRIPVSVRRALVSVATWPPPLPSKVVVVAWVVVVMKKENGRKNSIISKISYMYNMYEHGVVKVFDNFTVGDSVKYYLICAVSFPFLFYFTYRLCVTDLDNLNVEVEVYL